MNEKEKKAVALKYVRKRDNAPKIVAKGKGVVAKNILDLAKENNIPVQEDAELVEILSNMEINSEIPPELYKAVAKILSYIYKNIK
ncbi:EscU/YscU/HrcU family type III secretion system export apparatus switch protein [Nitrosophilus alvini]|uniref:EscU/YscU/HrcU family type III secretion system export apparatus switch protein n=1 Tax=Nitrosophilus alvini TaxID=2714855 RepID=UPI0019098881|nr:EscU/YscU/HrcU family type III secretion system export apparatus switch protein [Nitrosophilus alvini]